MGSTCFARFGVPPLRKSHHTACISRTYYTSSSSISASPPPSSLVLTTPSPLVVCAQSNTFSEAPQRSEEWFALRRDKLTASTFSTALGFWKGNRRADLWYEKTFCPEAVALEASAIAAMSWGVTNEPAAIERYKTITGQEVGSMGFAVHGKAQYGWLGASPDGLLGCSSPDGGGILEVKCPYNKGKPELGLPWPAIPYYYVPQVQGLMEIMDREWADVYCWTPNGSALFRIQRQREYWDVMQKVLQEFWWGSVVPARHAVMTGKEEGFVRAYEPKPRHELTGMIIGRSRKLAAESKLVFKEIAGHVEFYDR